jgi:very-short-patch-repair endonuclease
MDKDEMSKRGLKRNIYCMPYNPKLTKRAKELRTNLTPAEELLWNEFLKKHKYRFRRQKQIDNYIVDFYCAKLKLVIEIDGEVHNSFDSIEYDNQRAKVIESYGISIMRFTNEDVFERFEYVCKSINDYN